MLVKVQFWLTLMSWPPLKLPAPKNYTQVFVINWLCFPPMLCPWLFSGCRQRLEVSSLRTNGKLSILGDTHGVFQGPGWRRCCCSYTGYLGGLDPKPMGEHSCFSLLGDPIAFHGPFDLAWHNSSNLWKTGTDFIFSFQQIPQSWPPGKEINYSLVWVSLFPRIYGPHKMNLSLDYQTKLFHTILFWGYIFKNDIPAMYSFCK